MKQIHKKRVKINSIINKLASESKADHRECIYLVMLLRFFAPTTVTLTFEHDQGLDIVKMHPHIKTEVPSSRLSKATARTGETVRHTDRCDRMHYQQHSQVRSGLHIKCT